MGFLKVSAQREGRPLNSRRHDTDGYHQLKRQLHGTSNAGLTHF